MRVTRLRRRPRNRVEVEVDGERWRTLPADVVVRAGLLPGVELDRPRLRAVARERRRSEALAAAAGVLRRRDVSVQGLEARLERRGVAPAARTEAVAAAGRAGLVDDERYAARRATALADRTRGDAAIRWQLEQEGVGAEVVERALTSLEAEAARAARVADRRGRTPATARYLAARGFAAETVEAALGAEDDSALG